MNARFANFGAGMLCLSAVLSATGALADPEARQCAPQVVAEIPGTDGRTVISDTPWVPGLGGEKVIYGSDNRIDVYQETSASRKALAGSVCALLSASQLTPLGGGGWHISTSAYLYQGKPACAGEPFGSQPTAAFCTGFLVGPDVVATAGHCYNSTDYAGVRFVFGFDMTDASTPEVDLAEDQVYTGVAVLGRQLNSSTGLDYAIIRLDRAVTAPGAVPLAIRRTGNVPLATAVGVIGYPAGLPKKIAFGAATRVADNAATGFFVANVDTYGGNSGSPVFNSGTGIVEGILVRGNPDFKLNGNCFVSNTLPDSTADAEQVSKAATFAQFVPEATGKGEIVLNRVAYSCAATLGITLTDPNASGSSQQATVTSGAGDTESVLLIETLAGSRTFTGTIALQAGTVTAQDGILNVADGTIITVLYSDLDTGLGAQENIIATAPVDCVPPVISNIVFSGLTGSSELAQFQTNEKAACKISYATTTCQDAGAATVSTAAGTTHSKTLSGLAPETPYFAAVTATDTVGNSATVDNGGDCYTFTTAANPLADGGFELGNPNPVWSQDSTAYGSVVCDAANCGLGNTTGPFEGAWWAWFGGVESKIEDGYVAQSVTIPDTVSALLTFQLEIPAAHVPGYLRVLMDGTQVFKVTEAAASAYATFRTVTVSLSAYTDGAPHVLRFEGHTDGTGGTGVTNFFIDDVGIAPSDEGEPVLQVTVPGVVGLAQAAAVSTMQTAGLTGQAVSQQCSDIFPGGQVVSQNPAAGALADQGSAVSLVVSTGPCTVPVEGEPVPVTETAQALYDGFDAADTNQDGALSLSEAEAAQPALTATDFMDIDSDDNGALSQDELAAYLGIDPGCGCACNKSDLTLGGLQERLGDLFLAGLSLAVLLLVASRRAR